VFTACVLISRCCIGFGIFSLMLLMIFSMFLLVVMCNLIVFQNLRLVLIHPNFYFFRISPILFLNIFKHLLIQNLLIAVVDQEVRARECARVHCCFQKYKYSSLHPSIIICSHYFCYCSITSIRGCVAFHCFLSF
jgi:hypothetical protein